MTRSGPAPTLTSLLLTVLAAAPLAAQEEAPLHRRYDFTRPAGRAALPGAVVEASGLTFTADRARLLVHGDERAVVVVLDPATGRETARFGVGRGPVEGDFEAIAAVGDRLFLSTSAGLLYEFREVGDGERSPYRLTDTRLGAGCEVEGLEHDRAEGALLVACKVVAPRGTDAVVHRVPLAPWDEPFSPVRIPLADLRAFGLDPALHPSAVALDPGTGRLLVLDARSHLLVEAARSGRVVSVVQLPEARHPQPEGLAVGADGVIYVADEARGDEPAHLTWYAPLAAAGRPGRGGGG